MNSSLRHTDQGADAPLIRHAGAALGLDPDLQPTSAGIDKARILVVEDHPFVRESIVNLINTQADLACCGQTNTISETPEVVARERPDLVLLDLRLSDGDALELIRALTGWFPEIAILILSQYEEILYAQKALAAGAKGYLMKQDAPSELLPAIHTVLGGGSYLSAVMTARLSTPRHN